MGEGWGGERPGRAGLGVERGRARVPGECGKGRAEAERGARPAGRAGRPPAGPRRGRRAPRGWRRSALRPRARNRQSGRSPRAACQPAMPAPPRAYPTRRNRAHPHPMLCRGHCGKREPSTARVPPVASPICFSAAVQPPAQGPGGSSGELQVSFADVTLGARGGRSQRSDVASNHTLRLRAPHSIPAGGRPSRFCSSLVHP